jgi:hypothetical protein
MNTIFIKQGLFKGGYYVIIKILGFRLSMQISYGTIVCEIYEKVRNWFGIDPKNLSLTRRLTPDGNRISNLE